MGRSKDFADGAAQRESLALRSTLRLETSGDGKMQRNVISGGHKLGEVNHPFDGPFTAYDHRGRPLSVHQTAHEAHQAVNDNYLKTGMSRQWDQPLRGTQVVRP